jgi:regulator of replication initiation timing
MANPDIPGWLTAIFTAAGAGIGAAARSIVVRWRSRRERHAQDSMAEATAADTLVRSALGLVRELQLELESLRQRLSMCQSERRLQEDVITQLRDLVDTLTEERDTLAKLLEEATRP